MSETLSKQKVIDLIKKTKDEVAESETAIADFAYTMLENLKQTEIADVAPVVHGRWILSTDMTYMPQCSNCGRHPFRGYIPSIEEVKRVYKHCPVCGAKMDEEKGGEYNQ